MPRQFTTILALYSILAVPVALARAQQDQIQANRGARIKALAEQLRWHSPDEMARYDATKDAVTRKLFSEIDGYISDNFQPGFATTEQIKAGVDALLGRKKGDGLHDVAFLADLPGGHFMIVGIELWRGGPAISEDAMSFRAYKGSESKFVPVASIDFPTGSNGGSLDGLNAEALKSPPVDGEFWLIAWADLPPLSPYKIITRLYAFDGKNFRTVWSPAIFISNGIDDAVQVTPDGRGFVVNEMPNWQSQTVNHEQYVLSPDGPQKANEWETPLE